MIGCPKKTGICENLTGKNGETSMHLGTAMTINRISE